MVLHSIILIGQIYNILSVRPCFLSAVFIEVSFSHGFLHPLTWIGDVQIMMNCILFWILNLFIRIFFIAYGDPCYCIGRGTYVYKQVQYCNIAIQEIYQHIYRHTGSQLNTKHGSINCVWITIENTTANVCMSLKF